MVTRETTLSSRVGFSVHLMTYNLITNVQWLTYTYIIKSNINDWPCLLGTEEGRIWQQTGSSTRKNRQWQLSQRKPRRDPEEGRDTTLDTRGSLRGCSGFVFYSMLSRVWRREDTLKLSKGVTLSKQPLSLGCTSIPHLWKALLLRSNDMEPTVWVLSWKTQSTLKEGGEKNSLIQILKPF